MHPYFMGMKGDRVLKLTKMELDPVDTLEFLKTSIDEALEQQIKMAEETADFYKGKKDKKDGQHRSPNYEGRFLFENAEYIRNLEHAIEAVRETCFERPSHIVQNQPVPDGYLRPRNDFPLKANPFTNSMNSFVEDIIRGCQKIENMRRHQIDREHEARRAERDAAYSWVEKRDSRFTNDGVFIRHLDNVGQGNGNGNGPYTMHYGLGDRAPE